MMMLFEILIMYHTLEDIPMGFELYQPVKSKNFKPFCTMYTNGKFMINAAAARQYELMEYKYLQFYYDRDTKRIGLKFFHEEVDHTLKCQPQKGQTCLCFMSSNFIEIYKIPLKANTRYEFFYDTDHELYIIDMTQPLEGRAQKKKRKTPIKSAPKENQPV